MNRYDLSHIMRRAWANYRKGGVSFAEALHRAWISAKAKPINAQRMAGERSRAGKAEAQQMIGTTAMATA